MVFVVIAKEIAGNREMYAAVKRFVCRFFQTFIAAFEDVFPNIVFNLF